MKAKIKVSDSTIVLLDNVRFNATFFAQENEFNKVFDKVAKDIKSFAKEIEALGVSVENINISPVQARANWVRQEKSSNNENEKVKKYELVQKGFIANGYISIELPLSWSDDTHKFSDIYFAIDKYKTKHDMRYEFFTQKTDIEKAKAELRSKLLKTAKTKLLEILDNENVKIKLVDITYMENDTKGFAYSNIYKESCPSDTKDEQKVFDADTINNLISINFAPESTLSDSIYTKWKIK